MYDILVYLFEHCQRQELLSPAATRLPS